ncbi:MAG: lysostaphin resistance A-like protein [Halodesulfurarchaeum sp.]
MAANGTSDRSRFVPSVGFVIGGLGIAASLLSWTPIVSVGPVRSLPGLIAAGIVFVAFALRRYGSEDRRLSLLAGLGSSALVVVAIVSLVYPAITHSGSSVVGIGVWAGFVVGLVGLGVSVSDWAGHSREQLLSRAQFAAAALLIGIVGLLVGSAFSIAFASILDRSSVILQRGASTIAFSAGLGVVAIGYLSLTDRDYSYIDVASLSRRDLMFGIVGVLAMFALLLGIGALTSILDIPSTQHGLIEEARDRPIVLLYFVPLSWLVIGPGEELLARNIIQKHLYDGYSRGSAVLVATTVFTVIHVPAYASTNAVAVFATLLRLFFVSLVLGIVYERTENLVVAALVHGTFNAVQFGVAYLAIVSGYM